MQDDRQVVIVTGAAGNLGRAVAAAFAADHHLALVDRDAGRLDAVYAGQPAKPLRLAADLLDAQATRDVVEAVLAHFGRVDALCNLAGGFDMGTPVHETPDTVWERMLDLNTRTLVHMVRATVPALISAGGGAIVNVGAAGAQRGTAHMAAYAVAKSAVQRITEAMSSELMDQGIRVNCVLPSILDTPENRAAMPGADPSHWVAPGDLANVIRFLASPAARAVHGAAVPVTGRVRG